VMRTLPDVDKADKEKRWRLGTIFRSSNHSYRYVQAGVDIKPNRAVKLGDTQDTLWNVSPANGVEEVHSATELLVKKNERFWLRDPDGITPFKIEVVED